MLDHMALAPDRLASWADVCTHLRARFPSARTRDEARLEVEVTLPNGSVQTVVIGTVDVFGVPWLDVRAVVGPARDVAPGKALGDNANTPVGALGVDGHELVLRQTLPLEGVRAGDLDEAVYILALRCHHGRKAVS